MDSGILEKMRLGVDMRFTVQLRGYSISLRPLSIVETVAVASEVQAEIKSKPAAMQTSLNEHVLFSMKTLRIASTSKPDANDPKLTEYELQNATPDELSYLFTEYCSGVERLNPSLEKLSMERLTELVNMAKKNNSILIALSFAEVVSVCRYLLDESQMAKSSGG